MDFSRYRIDLPTAYSAWLDYLQVLFTQARAPFWWPTLAAALAGVLLVAWMRNAGTGVSLSSRADAPSPGAGWRRFVPYLRELPVDVLCLLGYLFTQVMMAPVLSGVTVLAISLVFAAGVPAVLDAPPGFGVQMAVAAMAFVCADFFLYWSHRLFHWGPFWRLHALHHRPAVLTPITAFRFWPPEVACHLFAFSLGEGIAFGVASQLFGLGVTPVIWLGVNVFLLAWFLAFSHLRHSHVPLPFPNWLSHVLVSPHMHQAHHSVDPAHHQRNLGTALALWDWMFGTLYLPHAGEKFRFGVDSKAI